ncbi:hypothetical protein ACIO3O_01215 [Streptomyces sp. NPDC087440]|uniref:hypothetical protein n=1 Tax=Streptomyces sp. NPDC087440 TaxID=3365790 RepID=UPI003823C298
MASGARGGRGALTALHLVLVWAAMAAVTPAFGFGLLVSGWGGGAGAAVLLAALGLPVLVGLLAVTALPVRAVVPLCGSRRGRLGWAVLVFLLGTSGVLAGVAAYSEQVDLGSAGTRIALAGVPYALVAAFFVPGPWVRLGAVAVLAAGVAYGGFIGPEQARRHQHEAEVARYRERPELLVLGTAPPGMQVRRAVVGPAHFSVEYGPVRRGQETGYVGLGVRPVITSAFQCPEFVEKDVTCAVDVRGEMRTVRSFPGGERSVTLGRRHGGVEVEVSSQSLGEPGLRRLLDTLHPLSDVELERLMQEKTISH